MKELLVLKSAKLFERGFFRISESIVNNYVVFRNDSYNLFFRAIISSLKFFIEYNFPIDDWHFPLPFVYLRVNF